MFHHLVAQDINDSSGAIAAVVSLAVLVLWVIMIVKFFQIARDIRELRDIFRRYEDQVLGDFESPDGGVEDEGGSGFTQEVSRLRELGALRQEGLLSDEEFETLKAGLLGRAPQIPPTP